ncbi:hypothetical protein Tco_1153003 [Tanacetum coccineum]
MAIRYSDGVESDGEADLVSDLYHKGVALGDSGWVSSVSMGSSKVLDSMFVAIGGIVFGAVRVNGEDMTFDNTIGYLKDGDGDGNSQPHKGVKASANSDVMYFFTSAQDGDPSQDDVRLCLGDDLKKAQDHSQRQADCHGVNGVGLRWGEGEMVMFWPEVVGGHVKEKKVLCGGMSFEDLAGKALVGVYGYCMYSP